MYANNIGISHQYEYVTFMDIRNTTTRTYTPLPTTTTTTNSTTTTATTTTTTTTTTQKVMFCKFWVIIIYIFFIYFSYRQFCGQCYWSRYPGEHLWHFTPMLTRNERRQRRNMDLHSIQAVST